MFMWAPLARRAKNTRFRRVLLYFLTVQCVLFLPTAYTQMRTEPHTMYARLHNGLDFSYFTHLSTENISVGETSDGYILMELSAEELQTHTVITESPEGEEQERRVYALYVSSWREALLEDTINPEGIDYLFGITPAYIYYRDANTFMTIATDNIPAWVIQEQDYGELFNYLMLNQPYFINILLPVVLFLFIAFLLGQIVFYWVIAYLFGQMRKFTTYMTFKERFVLCVFASIPALLPGFLVGLIMPVFNIFIFEMVVVFVAFKISNEY